MASEAQSSLQIPQPPIPRTIDADEALISRILEKSREGKIVWHREKNIYRANTSGSLSLVLETNDLPVFGRTWASFSVSRWSKEIFRLDGNASGTSLLNLAGLSLSGKSQIVDQLLDYLEHARKEEVRNAMREIEQL